MLVVGFVVIVLVLVVGLLPGIPKIAGQGGSVRVRTWVSPPWRVMVVVTGTIVTLAMGVIVLVPSLDVMLTL
jgi:CBS domain containing-hemolysin-like protein